MAEPGTTMAPPLFNFREEDLVTLFVGPDEQKLLVHESCIIRNSDFFKAAMKKEWIEGQTRTVKLPDEHCMDTFIQYLNFTYHGKLPTEAITLLVGPTFIGDPYIYLAKTYVLGERMLDRSVQHAVIREIIRLTTIKGHESRARFPGSAPITIAYEGTSTGSPIRRLLVDQRVVKGSESWSFSENPEFLKDLSKALLKALLDQKTIRDCRDRVLAAEDYFD
jgi:hypothetical protein